MTIIFTSNSKMKDDMRKFRMVTVLGLSLAGVASLSLLAYAAGGKYSGNYFVYSGGLGDREPPTGKDAKVYIDISGPLAAEMYNQLGKSAEQKSCSADTQKRQRGEASCSLSDGQHRCFVNFDLRTGKVWGGTIC
jgi:hypothetical protein